MYSYSMLDCQPLMLQYLPLRTVTLPWMLESIPENAALHSIELGIKVYGQLPCNLNLLK